MDSDDDMEHMPFEVSRRYAVAPIATGSKTTGLRLILAARPAANMPSLSLIVPKLMSNAPITLLRSSTSFGCVAMIGEAPTASVAFAESLMTTLLVICASG